MSPAPRRQPPRALIVDPSAVHGRARDASRQARYASEGRPKRPDKTMDAATATPPTDFVPRAAHVQLAGDLDTEATPVKVKGTWAYARSTAMGAKGVELPFSYERTRAATPADVYVKVPDQKRRRRRRSATRDGCGESGVGAANAALKADADRAVEQALDAADAGRASPREPWEGFYEGSFVLRRHGGMPCCGVLCSLASIRGVD